MYVMATFEHSVYLELALTELEQNGVPRTDLLAVPLDKRSEPRMLMDTMHRSDGFSMLDLAAILGTCLMLLGSIYGYVWKWGPIIWGIIGATTGGLLGITIKYLLLKKNGFESKKITSEVVVLIRCEEQMWSMVERVLWDNIALGVARVNLQPRHGMDKPQAGNI